MFAESARFDWWAGHIHLGPAHCQLSMVVYDICYTVVLIRRGHVMAARYKVVLVGDKGVGKTSLFHRVLFGYFKDTDEDNRSTLGFDCFEKSFTPQGELVEVK